MEYVVSCSNLDPNEDYVLLNPVDSCDINLIVKFHMHEWLLDLAHIFHVASHIDLFNNLHEHDFDHVVLYDDIVCKVVGMGDISVKFDGAVCSLLSGVRYIHGMNMNLIYVGQLEKMGLIGKIEHGLMKIINGVLVTCKGVTRDGVCVTTVYVIRGVDSSVSFTNTNDLYELHTTGAQMNDKKLLGDIGAVVGDRGSYVP